MAYGEWLFIIKLCLFGDDFLLLVEHIFDHAIGAITCPPVPAFVSAAKDEKTSRYFSIQAFRRTGL